MPSHVILLTGERGAGKSTLCAQVAHRAQASGLHVGGIWCRGRFVQGVKTGCFVQDLAGGPELLLGSCLERLGSSTWNHWSFAEDVVAAGNRAVEAALDRPDELVILDEVGPLELVRGQGFRPALDRIFRDAAQAALKPRHVLLVVRPGLASRLAMSFPEAPLFRIAADPQDRGKALTNLMAQVLT